MSLSYSTIEDITMFQLIKDVFAAFCSIILELCKGTESLAKSYSETTATIHDYAKTLRPTEEQLQADNDIAKLQRDIVIVENLNKLKAKLGDDANAIAVIDAKINAMKQANKPK